MRENVGVERKVGPLQVEKKGGGARTGEEEKSRLVTLNRTKREEQKTTEEEGEKRFRRGQHSGEKREPEDGKVPSGGPVGPPPLSGRGDPGRAETVTGINKKKKTEHAEQG